MLFSQLSKSVEGDSSIYSDIEINRISTDSRSLTGAGNELFISLVGKRNGHDFVKDAWKKGVRNFILQKPIELPESNSLIVKDTLLALQDISLAHRSQFHFPVIGITGSNGKTTVKEWLSTLLSEKFLVVKSPKSYNSQVGVPLSLLEIRNSHEIGVFEAGISLPGEMQKLQRIIKPSIGILTNIGQAHDDGFESVAHKIEEKLKLFYNCEKVICRSDGKHFNIIKDHLEGKVIDWGLEGEPKYLIYWHSSEITVNELSFKVLFEGRTQLENLTHVIVCALEVGLSKEEIQKGLNLIEGIPMRLELKKGINGCYILDDSYNNDEAGLKVALDYLASHQQNEKKNTNTL